MQEITIKSPAKINFGLNVINKREDGYHNIETIFYPVNLYDIINFRVSDKLLLETNSVQLNSENDNLILNAVELLSERTFKKITPEIFLQKNIPIGAGLGGGSSNAAVSLIALNELYDLQITKDELLKLSLQLGSDAPFFIENTPSYAKSRGEKLKPINFKIPFPILLVNPGIHISTRWAYENIKPQEPAHNLLDIVNNISDWEKIKDLVYNDFEPVVLSKYSELKYLKEALYSYGSIFSLMTGSGSTFFGIFRDTAKIEKAKSYFKKLNYFTFVHNE